MFRYCYIKFEIDNIIAFEKIFLGELAVDYQKIS